MDFIMQYGDKILVIIGSITSAVVAITSFIKALKSENRVTTTVNTVVDGMRAEMKKLDERVTVTRQGIVQGFKDAVVTKDVKVSINNQVKLILEDFKKDILAEVKRQNQERTQMTYWALKILRYTAAYDKLTVEQQTELDEVMALIAEDEKIVDTIA